MQVVKFKCIDNGCLRRKGIADQGLAGGIVKIEKNVIDIGSIRKRAVSRRVKKPRRLEL